MLDRAFQVSALLFFVGLVALVTRLPPDAAAQDETALLRQLNNKTAPLLSELVKTKYFRLIRLNLNSKCPLPYVNKLCESRSCTVCRCDEKDIPQNWIITDKVRSTTEEAQDIWSQERDEAEGRWVWHVEDEENDKGEYFDVHTNVQSFTKYNGQHIWKLIYEENCFRGISYLSEMCLEEQVLYKIISGLHTSISSHLSRLYKNVTKPSAWADKFDAPFYFNHHEYNSRVLSHPDRISNLLFLYELLLRSVQKVIPVLEKNLIILTDNIAQDLQATKLMGQLLAEVKSMKFRPLNETDAAFFQSENPHVKMYQKYFHNISSILNCVECEKCRLFGKMQTYGTGTALKVLLGYGTTKRNEIVAIFNTLNKISISVNTYFNYQQYLKEGLGAEHYKPIDYGSMRLLENSSAGTQENPLLLVKIWASCGFVVVAFAWIVANWNPKQKIRRQFKHAFPPGATKLSQQ